MMAIDTSALMAILLKEPEAEACLNALQTGDRLVISAATVAEALIVSDRRQVGASMAALLDSLGFEIITVSASTAQRVADVHREWGRGQGTAGLNFGDCFSYDTAKSHNCPLLFIGDDFRKTDIISAL
jgi:ribonuclease VapC